MIEQNKKTVMEGFRLEVCANSYESAAAAEEGGAIRVELCENMAEGGTTPSYGQIQLCKNKLNLEVWPIIRPRGGDFLYSDDEFEIMKADILACKDLKCDGVVTGILNADGSVDKDRCAELVKLAFPVPVAFHRAFDLCSDLGQALETIVETGFVRILTSGAAQSALLGAEKISELIKQASGRIELMPGAGINPTNIATIAKQTGATVFHASARIPVESKMLHQGSAAYMGETDNYTYELTSVKIVKQLIQALQTI